MTGLVVFDLDGTLFCTHEHLIHAVRSAARDMGLAMPDEALIRDHIGQPNPRFAASVVPDCSDIAGFVELLRKYERSALEREAPLFPGVLDMMQELRTRNYCLTICSNGSQEYIGSVIKASGLTPFIREAVLTSGTSKAHAIKEMASRYPTSNVTIVGDRQEDIEAASAGGFPSVGVTYGYGAQEEMGGATARAKTVDHVLSLIQQFTVFSCIWQETLASSIRCVGINGVDTSGKSTFTVALAHYLRSRGRDVVVVHLDDFHNPRAVRRMGDNENDAYIRHAFNLEALVDQVLRPLREQGFLHTALQLLDLDSDTYTLERQYCIETDTLVLLEGVLLYRPPVEDYIDYKVFLDISFDEVLRRASVRDVPKYGEAFLQRYHVKYIPIQQWYIQTYSPHAKSHMVIDNEDYARPSIVGR